MVDIRLPRLFASLLIRWVCSDVLQGAVLPWLLPINTILHIRIQKQTTSKDMYDIWHEIWKERIQCQDRFRDIWPLIGCLPPMSASHWSVCFISLSVMWSWAGNVTGQLSINIPRVFSGPRHYDNALWAKIPFHKLEITRHVWLSSDIYS